MKRHTLRGTMSHDGSRPVWRALDIVGQRRVVQVDGDTLRERLRNDVALQSLGGRQITVDVALDEAITRMLDTFEARERLLALLKRRP